MADVNMANVGSTGLEQSNGYMMEEDFEKLRGNKKAEFFKKMSNGPSRESKFVYMSPNHRLKIMSNGRLKKTKMHLK